MHRLGHHRAAVGRVADPDPYRKEERGADTRLAFKPDFPAHHLHQRFADGQPQSGAAVLARGGHVGLRERLEQLGALFARHAGAGVAHRKAQHGFLADALHQRGFQVNFAALGELDGVVDDVREHLTEAQRIPDQVERHRVRNVDEKLEPLVVCLLKGDGRDATHDIFEIEVDGLNIELAGFDFAEIEDVVDDAEQ